jgi:hypothetical protein
MAIVIRSSRALPLLSSFDLAIVIGTSAASISSLFRLQYAARPASSQTTMQLAYLHTPP